MPVANDNEPQWLSEEQAAQRLGMSRSWLETQRLRGKPHPPYARFGAAIRYRAADVDTWAATRVVASK
jgi:predicted DNA-binding transcriptional regulator AlpA